MNLAAIWKLPVIYVVENNNYSMGTRIDRGTAMAHDLSAKAAAYGMRFERCDGMDVLDTYRCFKNLGDTIRGSTQEHGPGPAFVEAVTYRYKGHSMSDPQKYRSKDEVVEHEQQDPINNLVNHLIDQGLATQDEITQLDKQAKLTAREAVRYANDSPDLPVDEMYTDVYTQPFGPFKKGDPPLILEHDVPPGEDD